MRYPILLFCSFILALAACHNGGSPKDKTATDSTTQGEPSVDIAPVSPQTEPAKGQYCRIHGLYTANDTTYIDAAYIQFLMGAAAGDAARRNDDAEIVINEKGDTIYAAPNGYYIVDMPGSHTLALAPDVQISLTGLKSSATTEEARQQLSKELRDGIYILTIEGGIVTRIREQFIP